MTQIRTFLIITFFSLGFAGCNEDTNSSQLPIQDKVITMGSETILQSGSAWVYKFNSSNRSCYIVGDNVTFIKREVDHVVVNLGGGLTLNIPTSGTHRVLMVNHKGYMEIKIDPEGFATQKELMQAILKADQSLKKGK